MRFAGHIHQWVQAMAAPRAANRLASRGETLLAERQYEEPWLDVGCGFASPLERIGGRPVGVDVDLGRARAIASPAAVADAARLPFPDGCFAAVFSFGLLHHLDDAHACRAIAEMGRVARRDGLIAVFDGIAPDDPWGRPAAALIRALDRGRHLRSEQGLIGLFGALSGWTFERVTYAASGLEGLWCVHRAR